MTAAVAKSILMCTLVITAALAVAAQKPAPEGESQATFEVASVKPTPPGSFLAAPQTPNGDGAAAFPACASGMMQVDPHRFAAKNTTLYSLVTLAYGIRYSCFIVSDAELLSGGPRWVLSDRFDVEATMPAGSPEYPLQQLQSGKAPALQAMLRNMLLDRFKLDTHKTMKE